MEADRFTHLENAPLPTTVRTAISRLDRFGCLELAHVSAIRASTPIPGTGATRTARLLCSHCHQSNEVEREFCWACFHSLKEDRPSNNKPSADQEIQLLLDGVNYSSADPALPDDIKALMARIRVQGFSPQLVKEWKEWKSNSGEHLGADPNVQAVRGTRVSILRLDGKVYKSDDVDLPPDIKEILDYIEREGVTPPLMQHLRLYGTKVKFRPLSALSPSDGDVDFWAAAQKG